MSLTGDDFSPDLTQTTDITQERRSEAHARGGSDQLSGFDDASTGLAPEDLVRDSPGISAESDELDRDGRFYGPDRSWRQYTHDVRALSTSLDKTECNDLSVHLYNAHALKANGYSSNVDRKVLQTRGKQNWRSPSLHGNVTFYPPDVWTAWPLLPIDVPRQREIWGVPTEHPCEQPGTYFKPERWKPSQHLEEEIGAVFERFAKNDVRRKAWHHELARPSPATSHLRARRSSRRSRQSSISGSNSPDDSVEPVEKAMIDLEAEAAERKPQQFDRELVPSLSVDDEKNSLLLKSSTRHLLAKMDDLLVGLHKGRQGHRIPHTTLPNSTMRSRPQFASNSNSMHHRAQDASPAKRRRFEKDLAVDPDPLGNVYAMETERSSERETRQARPSSSARLGLRDWSEVLSTAALVGWDPVVIKRAAQRCSVLFDEGFEMRAMPEASTDTTLDRIDRYVPDLIPISDTTDSDSESLSDDSDNGPEFACPIVECPRHVKPFIQRWRLREHLKKTHGQTKEEVEVTLLVAGMLSESEGSAAETDAETDVPPQSNSESSHDGIEPSANLVSIGCPHSSCNRHSISFDSRWRLREHLKRKHGNSIDEIELLVPRIYRTNGEPVIKPC